MSEPARHSGLGAHRQPGRAERPAGGRHRARRAGLRLAAACAAALTLLTAAPAGALPAGGNVRPAADSSGTAEFPVVMTIDTLSPQVATPNGIVTITGQVTNAGKSAVKGAHAAVRKPYKPLDRRNDLAIVADRGTPDSKDGVELDSPQYALPELNPGQSQPYTLSVAVSDLGLSAGGAYELAVDAWGGTADNPRDRALGIARTFLPYNPAAEAQPTKVATVWPLVHPPVLAAQTVAGSDSDQPVPVLRDDSLATEFAPGGRLYELVDTGAKLNGLTWVVDPDLLDAALAMTKTYRVQKPGTEGSGKSAKDDNTIQVQGGSPAAVAWLDKLRAAVAKPGSQVVALPYADPDLASIAHNGSDLAGMTTALSKAATAGRLTVEGRLAVDTRSDVAWPYQGHVDQQIAALAQQSGSGLVLVNGGSMPEPDSLNYTPTAVRPIGNGQSAVVADETVSALFYQDLSSPQAQTRATQRFLAETFAITHEQPQNQRGLLVLPPRELSAANAKALASALQTADGKWISSVKLDTVVQSAADPKANTAVPAPTDYPTQSRASELPAADLSRTDDIQHDLDTLMRVLTLPQRVRGPFSAAMVRSLSTEWRSRPPAGSAYRAGVTGYLKELTNAVQVPKKNRVTLAGNTGLLQVSVRNDLTQTVTNLKLVLTSAQPNRLRVSKEEELVLPASQSVTLRFNAEAHNNGPVAMTAQLWTTGPDSRPYGEPQKFRVEVTSVTNGVLYVFAGAGLLLLLAALRFVRQRKRRGGQPHEDGDQPVGDGPAAGDGGAAGSAPRPAADGAEGGAAQESAADPAGAPAPDGTGGTDDTAGGGPAQTPRGSSPDGRDRAASDEKVGP
ncbi:DUF6049 family protein [Kitasatospora sp. NPDC001547]|uniref:DUF6049 family protein n=1 Tax=Kitasatospora sp. NPDC001547 TaxID=3364015 RepID=UPI0036752E19|nr:DUF6049 family protein [Kitasatospora sp. Xyl93]